MYITLADAFFLQREHNILSVVSYGDSRLEVEVSS